MKRSSATLSPSREERDRSRPPRRTATSASAATAGPASLARIVEGPSPVLESAPLPVSRGPGISVTRSFAEFQTTAGPARVIVSSGAGFSSMASSTSGGVVWSSPPPPPPPLPLPRPQQPCPPSAAGHWSSPASVDAWSAYPPSGLGMGFPRLPVFPPRPPMYGWYDMSSMYAMPNYALMQGARSAPVVSGAATWSAPSAVTASSAPVSPCVTAPASPCGSEQWSQSHRAEQSEEDSVSDDDDSNGMFSSHQSAALLDVFARYTSSVLSVDRSTQAQSLSARALGGVSLGGEQRRLVESPLVAQVMSASANLAVTGRREGPLPAFDAGRVTDLPGCLSAGRLISPTVRSSDSGVRLPWTQSVLPASSVPFSPAERAMLGVDHARPTGRVTGRSLEILERLAARGLRSMSALDVSLGALVQALTAAPSDDVTPGFHLAVDADPAAVRMLCSTMSRTVASAAQDLADLITDVIILRRDAVLAASTQPTNARTMLRSLPFHAGSLFGPFAPAVVRQSADQRRDEVILSSAGRSSSRGRSSQTAPRRSVEPRSRSARPSSRNARGRRRQNSARPVAKAATAALTTRVTPDGSARRSDPQ